MIRTTALRHPGGISCREARPRLAFLIEHETDPLDTLRTRRHIADCAGCRRRADSLARVMSDVSSARAGSTHPPVDIASSVMARLRGVKARALAGGTAEMAMKWTGLLLVLTAGLGAWARHGGAGARVLASPFAAIVTALGDVVDEEAVRSILTAAGPVVMKVLNGEPVTDLAARAGLDLTVPLQIGLTAVTLLSVLALPVSGLLAWMLRERS